MPPYITRDSQNRAARAIITTGNELDKEALLHRKLEDGTREKRVRRLPYVIIYEVPDEQRPDILRILSIWHTKQDRFASDRR